VGILAASVSSFDWNDLRVLLAVARKGSTTAAARELETSPSTAARRVTALEEALGVELFERRPDGYHLTEAGRALVPAAERMEAAAAEAVERLEALARGASGVVRLTTLDSAATEWVIPILRRFHEAHPRVHVEVLTGDTKLDLLRGEADVALRFGPRPTETGLVVRRLRTIETALYCSQAYAAKRGLPADVAALNEHAIVRGSGYVDERPHHRWLAEHAPRAMIAHRSNSSIGILEAVRRGLGIGSLATDTGDLYPELVRLVGIGPVFTADVWLITTEDARKLAHVRALLDFMTAELKTT
jgi:molybdate transport repressor ModE-like protein